MNINEIKKIIEEEGGKIIIPGENGSTIIIMTLDDYRNGKINNYKKSEPKNSTSEREVEKDSLRIDDLPFN